MIQGFQVSISSFNILQNNKWVLLINSVLDDKNDTYLSYKWTWIWKMLGVS